MNKELIYKDDAIACLCNKKCDTEGRWCDDGDCAPVARIKSLPPVQSERKSGCWLNGEDEHGHYGVCSECGYKQYAGTLKFCPDCGADMRG